VTNDRPAAYVPGYDHDLFISYSSVDDQKDAFEPQGWVSTFVDLLSKRLTKLLGRRDSFSLWMDRNRLDGTFQLTPGIETPLHKTAVMLALISKGYLNSDWCPWEREVFLRGIAPTAGEPARIVVVELDRIAEAERPREFTDYLSYRFWVQETLDAYPRLLSAQNQALASDYKDRIDNLARVIVKLFDLIKERALPALKPITTSANGPPARPRATVYLAEPTDDLDPIWWAVKSYLEQQNLLVVRPPNLLRDPDACSQAVVSSLADADLFVQFLSKVPGRRVESGQSFASLQYDCARKAKLPILQWRDRTLTEQELASVQDNAHRELLEGPEVQAVFLEEFKQEILETLERHREEQRLETEREKKRKKASEGNDIDKFVYVVADPKDQAITQSILGFLKRRGFPHGGPLWLEDMNSTPAEISEDFRQNVQLADGTVIVYGQTRPLWYRSQMAEVCKLHVKYQQDNKQRRVGLFVGPPPKINSGLLALPGVDVIPGEEGIDDCTIEHSFQPFLDKLLDFAEHKN
jgi:TIR domain